MKAQVNGIEVDYTVHGENGPWITLSHSLGCSQAMWQPQIRALSQNFRVLSYDLRGHGASSCDEREGTTDLLTDDLVSLLDELDIEKTALIGISIGGMIGQKLAAQHPNRVSWLVLANTTPFMPPQLLPDWTARIDLAREKGLDTLADPTLERWFSERFRTEHPDIVSRLKQDFSATSVAGYVTCVQAIMALDIRNLLADIKCPTLIIGGTEDPGAPAAVLEGLQSNIKGAELRILEGAGHLSSVDHPAEFTQEIENFASKWTRAGS